MPETQRALEAPGFSLGHFLLLWPCRGLAGAESLSICLSLSLYLSNKSVNLEKKKIKKQKKRELRIMDSLPGCSKQESGIGRTGLKFRHQVL